MEGTDISSFQAVGTQLQRQEEEEDEQERKRRTKELQNIISNVLHWDADDDDICSVNSSQHIPVVRFQDESAKQLGHGDSASNAIQNSNEVQDSGIQTFEEKGAGDSHSSYGKHIQQQQHISSDVKPVKSVQFYTDTLMDKAGNNPDPPLHYANSYSKSYNTPTYDDNERFRQAEYDSKEQLQILYEVRVREVERLAEQMEELKAKSAIEKEQMFRKLSLLQAEKERAVLQNTQANQLLVAGKARINELEQEVQTMKTNLANLEASNTELKQDLEAARSSVKDLEQQIAMFNRENFNTTDVFLRGVQERHEKEVSNLQRQIDTYAAKLTAKESECESLQRRLSDLTRSHETMLIEKSETINHLVASLEESQKRCQQLVATQNNTHPTTLQSEHEQLKKQYQLLEAELQRAKADIKDYEAMAQLGLLRVDDSDTFMTGSKNNPKDDENVKLRDQLQRCQASLKLKREENRKLRSQVETKDKAIKTLKDKMDTYVLEADKLKDNARKLLEELDKQKAVYAIKPSASEEINIASLQRQVQELQSELMKINTDKDKLLEEMQIDRYRNAEERLLAKEQISEEYLRWHDAKVAHIMEQNKQELEIVTRKLSVQLEEARKECDEVKKQYIEVSSSKEKLIAALNSEQKVNEEVTEKMKKSEAKLKEVQAKLEAEEKKVALLEEQLLRLKIVKSEAEEAQKLLVAEQQKVTALQNALDEAQQHEARYKEAVVLEIEKAKAEALREMEKDMRERQRKQPVTVAVATSPMQKVNQEKKEREEMEKAFTQQLNEKVEQVKRESVKCLADELGAAEAKHQAQLEQLKEEYSRQLSTFKVDIDSKAIEMELVKQAMLKDQEKLRAERENTERLVADLTQKLAICQQELTVTKVKNLDLLASVEEWQKKLTSREEEVEEERQKMAEMITTWAEELQGLQTQHQESQKKIRELQEKYENAKKTARRYKDWAKGKEEHMAKEWQRISVGFQRSLEILRDKVDAALAIDENQQRFITQQLDIQIQELQEKLNQYRDKHPDR